ncbi:hypothetical protein LCGC14_0382030 [marine sediment metagenome]|uniref:Uncharacterized protein n=1 Tax=marine sediment metagenome TaxID=412755 RepID=A0A0F9VPG6_9ZZZZ
MKFTEHSKVSKKLARYRKAPTKSQRNCSNCVHFNQLNYRNIGEGSCDIVQGIVQSTYTSDFFSPSPEALVRVDEEEFLT